MYDKSLSAMFEQYARFDLAQGKSTGGSVTMSYQAYMEMGKKLGLYPGTVTSQDFVYIYKSMMKAKKQQEQESAVKYDTITDVQGTRLNFNEFKEAMLKLACLGKYKLGGGPTMSLEEIKAQQQQEKERKKRVLGKAARTGVLKKGAASGSDDDYDGGDSGNIQEELIGVFNREFDVSEMTPQTVESLFK